MLSVCTSAFLALQVAKQQQSLKEKTKGMKAGGKVKTKGYRAGGKVKTKGYRRGGKVRARG